jgi:hypothetical protein
MAAERRLIVNPAREKRERSRESERQRERERGVKKE